MKQWKLLAKSWNSCTRLTVRRTKRGLMKFMRNTIENIQNHENCSHKNSLKARCNCYSAFLVATKVPNSSDKTWYLCFWFQISKQLQYNCLSLVFMTKWNLFWLHLGRYINKLLVFVTKFYFHANNKLCEKVKFIWPWLLKMKIVDFKVSNVCHCAGSQKSTGADL